MNFWVVLSNMSENCIYQYGAGHFADALEVNKSLTWLDLSENHIGVDGADDLADALKVNESLKTIYLNSNPIGANGAEYFADALKVNKSLHTFEIAESCIGNEGAVAIIKALEFNDSITSLFLEGNELSFSMSDADDIIKALKVNQSLASIELACNKIDDKITDYIVKQLQNHQFLPKIDISYQSPVYADPTKKLLKMMLKGTSAEEVKYVLGAEFVSKFKSLSNKPNSFKLLCRVNDVFQEKQKDDGHPAEEYKDGEIFVDNAAEGSADLDVAGAEVVYDLD